MDLHDFGPEDLLHLQKGVKGARDGAPAGGRAAFGSCTAEPSRRRPRRAPLGAAEGLPTGLRSWRASNPAARVVQPQIGDAAPIADVGVP
ncbi:MAG: hypothetical protein AT711_08060 [Thermoproteus sp. CIS_19]|nr:MAG: hypothetical protein AT711_08060 [Thermoproteus sp. CIS_19]